MSKTMSESLLGSEKKVFPAIERPSGLFEKVVVGVDSSPESLTAIDQAAQLLAPHGLLTLVAAYNSAAASPSWGYNSYAFTYPEVMSELKEEAQARLAAAVTEARRVATQGLVDGAVYDSSAATAILRAAHEHGGDLVVVGCHDRSRSWGALSGSTSSRLAHSCDRPLLVARAKEESGVITVGIDGSEQSRRAHHLASELARALGAELRVLVAFGRDVDLEAVKDIEYDYRASAHDAVAALVEASAESDIVVVGSRGLTGFKALGSVSERVVHQATCSVLVVR